MRQWLKVNATYQQILITAFISLLAWLAVHVVSKVDAMSDRFVRKETVVELKQDIRDLGKEMRDGFSLINQSIIDLWQD